MKVNYLIFYISCLLLLAPLVGLVFPDLNPKTDLVENRKLADFPKFNLNKITDYPEAFEGYFDDHFGFRSFLIKLNGKYKRKVFGIKEEKAKVLSGKDEWLFFTGNDSVEDYRGLSTFTPEHLEKWADILTKKQEYLKSVGVDYLFVVAPNKSSIYPEYLPDWMTKVAPQTPLDQLLSYLKRRTDLNVLDLRDSLLAKKNNGVLLYHPTDTHWNSMGAFVGYREIMAHLGLPFTRHALSDHDVDLSFAPKRGGDLAKMLGIQSEVRETAPQVVPIHMTATKQFDFPGPPRDILMQAEDRTLPRLLVFRDSFSEALIPFLSESFSYSRYVWSGWGEDTPIKRLLEESTPDVVIEEWVERLVNEERLLSYADPR